MKHEPTIVCIITMTEDENGQMLNIDSHLEKDTVIEILEMSLTLTKGEFERHVDVKH